MEGGWGPEASESPLPCLSPAEAESEAEASPLCGNPPSQVWSIPTKENQA